MKGAEFTAEAHCGWPEEVVVECAGPFQDDAFRPDAIDEVQNGDRALVTRTGPTAGFRDHGHVGVQPILRPAALVLHPC